MAITACALTDGDFVNRFQPPVDTGCVPDDLGQGCGSARADRVLTVDLDAARPASLLVVRGITADVVAETSVDGESWAGVGSDCSSPRPALATSACAARPTTAGCR
ncbi:hypothetical protein [Myxococcus sp. AB056]|uniref:hypothetical protein n=1 Tax=Myxococcus sp. AB056 TaxID=2562792 RepID=UPI001890C72E|nr:hypothetical protein [Myxococcus sp. AB056]